MNPGKLHPRGCLLLAVFRIGPVTSPLSTVSPRVGRQLALLFRLRHLAFVGGVVGARDVDPVEDPGEDGAEDFRRQLDRHPDAARFRHLDRGDANRELRRLVEPDRVARGPSGSVRGRPLRPAGRSSSSAGRRPPGLWLRCRRPASVRPGSACLGGARRFRPALAGVASESSSRSLRTPPISAIAISSDGDERDRAGRPSAAGAGARGGIAALGLRGGFGGFGCGSGGDGGGGFSAAAAREAVREPPAPAARPRRPPAPLSLRRGPARRRRPSGRRCPRSCRRSARAGAASPSGRRSAPSGRGRLCDAP